MAIRRNELFNTLSHLAGAAASIALTAVFYFNSIDLDPWLALSVCVSAASYVFLFASSAIYHANKTADDERSVWLALDHCAIFVMIAGSYVGPLYIYAPEKIRWAVLGTVWFFAFTGAALKLRFLISPNWINVAIYAPIGIISVVPMALLWSSVDAVPAHAVSMTLLKSLLVGGLAVYALAGAVYATKWPDPRPEIVGFHGIFHFLVLAGAGMHALALYFSIRAYPVIREFQAAVSVVN